MAKAGRRYPLVVYRHMLNRWWPATLTLALALAAVAWGISRLPVGRYLVTATLGLAGLTFIVTVFLFIIRTIAYVQPCDTYLRLVTPFLRINISYRRFRGTTTTEMHALFPPKSISGWRREIIAPLASLTAIVINLNGYPVPPMVLRWFLSPFFFKDKTPHLVILVKDWLRFSSELDSMRLSRGRGGSKPARPRKNSILSRLPRE
jgi:hypothetical protein